MQWEIYKQQLFIQFARFTGINRPSCFIPPPICMSENLVSSSFTHSLCAMMDVCTRASPFCVVLGISSQFICFSVPMKIILLKYFYLGLLFLFPGISQWLTRFSNLSFYNMSRQFWLTISWGFNRFLRIWIWEDTYTRTKYLTQMKNRGI